MTMRNKITAVEWLSNQAYELFEQYSEGKFDRIQLNKFMVEATNQAKWHHIVDTNEMADQVTDIENLAEEVYLEHENNDLLYGESLQLIHAYKAGIVDGYNKAKETLYTEEQLREAMEFARGHHKMIDTQFIQSLKKD